MTKSRGIRRRRGSRLEWVAANQGRFFCQCGCGEPIPLRPEHVNVGVPRFRRGHGTALLPSAGRARHSAGYMYVLQPDHPHADCNGRVLEHRLVMEQHLRTVDPGSDYLVAIDGVLYLRPEITVHHENGVKDDNRVENLEAMTRGEHTAMHNPRLGTGR